MSDQTPRNAAGQALFQMQFAVMMLNCGRTEEANKAFEEAQAILTKLEEEMSQ